MRDVLFDLKRVDGKTVQWQGTGADENEAGMNAAVRYVDCMRVFDKDDGGGIVATRIARERVSVSVLGGGTIIG